MTTQQHLTIQQRENIVRKQEFQANTIKQYKLDLEKLNIDKMETIFLEPKALLFSKYLYKGQQISICYESYVHNRNKEMAIKYFERMKHIQSLMLDLAMFDGKDLGMSENSIVTMANKFKDICKTVEYELQSTPNYYWK